MNRTYRIAAFSGLLVLAAGCWTATEPDPEYLAGLEEHRAARVARLAADDGWLTLVGLFWLEQGPNSFGSDPSNAIVLPEGAAPAAAGRLLYDGETVRLEAGPGVETTIDGAPIVEATLADDGADGGPDLVRLGRLSFHVIERGGRHAIRVKDPESPRRTEFQGLEYFPVDPAYRVRARFQPFDEPLQVTIETVIGTRETMYAPGTVEFDLRGRRWSIRPLVGDPSDEELFFVFRDGTSGSESYGAGRFLYARLEGREIDLDFNRAYNPPCAFTPFATCPLPPPENRFDARIEAGERTYGDH